MKKIQKLQVTLNEVNRMQQLAGIIPLNESSAKINESIFEKGKTYGGSKCEGGCFTGKEGLEKILKISKESPNNVFIIRDDNYSKLQPHFVKNGVIAKANTIGNPSYDLDRHKVRNLNIGKDVILSIKLFESINEASNNDDTYFDTTSEAVTYAKTQAEKRGFEIDENDWHSQITMGGKYNRTRPGVGKTNSFSVGLLKGGKPQRKNLNISIYGMESGKFELTYYIN
jgi:hypothetical protein